MKAQVGKSCVQRMSQTRIAQIPRTCTSWTRLYGTFARDPTEISAAVEWLQYDRWHCRAGPRQTASFYRRLLASVQHVTEAKVPFGNLLSHPIRRRHDFNCPSISPFVFQLLPLPYGKYLFRLRVRRKRSRLRTLTVQLTGVRILYKWKSYPKDRNVRMTKLPSPQKCMRQVTEWAHTVRLQTKHHGARQHTID